MLYLLLIELNVSKMARASPDSSGCKEFAGNAGDPNSIPGSGRSAVEGTGYPLQYSWASLVAQLVKNLLAMRETWVPSLGFGRSSGEWKGYQLQYSGLENPRDRGAWWAAISGVAQSQA